MPNTTASPATPVTVRRQQTMRRIRTADLAAAARRANGYRGPLTRAELARMAAR
jgi:hypothetical protein